VDEINKIKISFIQGDICEEEVEAIGNSNSLDLINHYYSVNGTDSLMRNNNSSIVDRAGRYLSFAKPL